MAIVLLILALAVLAGILSGGSGRFLERLRVHWWGLAPIALVLQAVPVPVGSAQRAGLAAASLVSSYVLLLAVVAVNRRVPGAALMAAGLTMNLAVVALNGGMPVGRDAIRVAGSDGVIVIEDGAKHHLMSDDDVLRPLADVVPVPPPFGVVLSIGDVLLYGGMAWWCFAVTRGRFRENIRPPARRFLMYRGKHAPESYRLPARYRGTAVRVPAEAARWGSDGGFRHSRREGAPEQQS
ncbi:MAG: DUF5317 family protein [Actinomycetota bacterium]